MYEVQDSSAIKNQRLKSIRLIELSDYMVRLNRRENTQLDLRLRQIKRQETIMKRHYDREIYWKRLQLAQIYDTLNDDTSDIFAKPNRVQTPMSFYSMKMRRNQSAPSSNIKQIDTGDKTPSRPSTTPTPIRRTKRSMSVFKDITLKPSCRTLGNMLVLLDNENNSYKNEWPIRSKTMINLKINN